MKTLNITTNATLHARYAKPSTQGGAGGIACSATLRSRFRRRKTEATVASDFPLSNTDRVTVHDKFMVIDGESVETGSFNYTTSAARYNSENAVVMWHVPVVAQAYQQHWQSRFNQGRPWSGQASN